MGSGPTAFLPSRSESPVPPDKLGEVLVSYFATADQMAFARLGESGHEPVELDDPWWRENGAIAFADPDN